MIGRVFQLNFATTASSPSCFPAQTLAPSSSVVHGRWEEVETSCLQSLVGFRLSDSFVLESICPEKLTP